MKLNLYILLAFISFSMSAFAQNAKVTGKVTEEDGEAMISASVVIDAGKGWAAVTDMDGNYTIELPAGTYDVNFTYLGKDPQKIKVTVAAGEKKVLNVVLKEKGKLIDEVVISGSKYEQKLSEQTVSMDVIKGSNLTNDNIVSLDEGMNKVPGVTIADGQINIRGGAGWSYGAGSRVQVLVDDLPLLSADAQDAKWSIVPMENVDQVEVIKGAASALYGSGALDGIVNVRTAYPTDQPYFKVSTYGGFDSKPTNTPDMADWWGGKLPLFGNNNWDVPTSRPYFEGVSFAYRQKFGQSDLIIGGAFDGSTGYLDSSASYQVRANIKYRYRFKNIPGLNMGINASGLYDWGQTFFFWNGLGNQGYVPFPKTVTVYKDQRFTVDPFVDYFDKNNNQFKFNGRFLNSTNTNSTGQGSVPNLYYTELQYHRKWDFNKFDMNFVSGVVNQYNDVNPPAGAVGSLFGKNNSENLSLYAQMDFKFFKKLTISVGARWEYFVMRHYVPDTTGTIVNNSGVITGYTTNGEKLDLTQNSLKQLDYPLGRIGINYQAAEATFIRASFGQGFRYPSIAERYVSTNVGPLTIASNPELQPEKGYSTEIGIKQGFALPGGWTGYADLAGFANFYQNMTEFSFGQFGPKSEWNNFADDLGFGFSSQNIGQTRIVGTELVLAGQGKLGPVDMQVMTGYTYIDARSLNWHDSLALYNYQGYALSNGGTAQLAYNQANNPTHSTAITYAETSTTSTNWLKYRSPHTMKFDITASWKGIEINTNMQFASFEKNIDYAFVSPLFQSLEGQAFQGVAQWRAAKLAVPIGRGRGDIDWNWRFGYNFKNGIKVAFLVKNILNWEYMARPAYFAEPRNYSIQLSYTMQPKKKKVASN